MDARCASKALCISKCQENQEINLALSLGYDHICYPYKSLTKRCGRPATPFMAANLADFVWSMAELLKLKNTKTYS